MPITLDGTNGITTPTYGGADTSEYLVPVTQFKNRLINSAMVIDQRNAGASFTPTDQTYSLDRWKCRLSQASKYTVQQNAGSVTPPAGFRNYLGVTSSAATSVGTNDYFAIQQIIEGFNVADLNYGTSNAQTTTLSFWVRSSLTGTFGGALQNSAENRNYGFTYAISSANTWEQKSVTITGDTSGTWLTTNGIGLYVNFNLGTGSTYGSASNGSWASGATQFTPSGTVSVVGTNGATFYITGVQLEVGSTATSFDYRPYGTELVLCQRYFETTYPIGTAVGASSATADAPVAFSMGDSSTETQQIIWMYKVKKRSSPTVTVYNPNSGSSGSARYANSLDINFSANGSRVDQATFGSATVGMNINNTFAYYLTASSEL